MKIRLFTSYVFIFLCGIYGGILFLQQHIGLYINPSYKIFFLFGVVVCLCVGVCGLVFTFFFYQIPKKTIDSNHITISFFPLVFFIIVAFLFPAQPLSVHASITSTIITRNQISHQSNTTISDAHIYQLYGQDTMTYSFQYWYLISGLKPGFEQNKWVHLTGMIVRQPHMPHNEFYLTRYLLTCCVADAIPIGFLVKYQLASGSIDPFTDTTWIDVVGQFRRENKQIILFPTSGRTIPPPQMPYIY